MIGTQEEGRKLGGCEVPKGVAGNACCGLCAAFCADGLHAAVFKSDALDEVGHVAQAGRERIVRQQRGLP